MISPRSKSSRWVLIFAMVVMLITSIPYALGFINQGESWRFTGFVFGVVDGNSYIAKMMAGRAGEWLFRTPFSAQDHKGALLFFPYLVLGKLAVFPARPHLQLVLLFHGFRFLAGMAMILATYDFLSLFIREENWRRWALIIISLGGGLGWLVAGLRVDWADSVPLAFISPESFGFLNLYGLPHLAAARALLLWGMRAFIVADRKIASGMLWMLLGLFQPIYVVVGWCVIGLYLVTLALKTFTDRSSGTPSRWWFFTDRLKRFLWTFTLSSPLVIYTALVFRMDKYLSQWAVQSKTLAPHPMFYLLAYGLLVPFLYFGAKNITRAYPTLGWLVVGWIAIVPFMVSFPSVIQRRLAEGVWVALVILAVKAFDGSFITLSKKWSYTMMLTFTSTIILFAGGIQAVSDPAPPLYISVEEAKTFAYVEEKISSNAVILCSFQTGNPLPAWAPVHVVLGHSPETANYRQIRREVAAFYRTDTPPQTRLDTLNRYQVEYVYWGPAERDLGDWDLGAVDFLTLRFQEGAYQIFQVNSAD